MSYRDLANQYAQGSGAQLTIKSMISSGQVTFPAFLKNLTQGFKSNWQTEDVFGRNDPIATFQSTKRTVAVSFDVPSASLQEAQTNLSKISTLIKFLYPAYYDNMSVESISTKSNLIMSKSPLVTVKFANLIQAQDGTGLLGYIDGVDFNPTLSLGMFASGKLFYPKNYEISFNLNVLHKQDIGFNDTGDWLNGNKKFPF
jgi:hypothetical protein